MNKEIDIEINIIAHNEEVMLEYTINWYRKMFKNPKIVLWDNQSTDSTRSIAKRLNCHDIKEFMTSGMNDLAQSDMKNDAIRNCKSDWCLVIDADEECLITEEDLLNADFNMVQFQGWNIFNKVSSPWESNFEGILDNGYSKTILIKTSEIKSATLSPGAHSISNIIPKEGFNLRYSIKKYKLVHMKHWSLEWNINRSKYLASRQSESNLKNKHSFHFAFSEDIHTNYFNDCYNRREPLIDKRLELLK